MSRKLSVPVALYRIVEELKKIKRGLTTEEILQRTDIVVEKDDVLYHELENNEYVQFYEKSQRFVYKFKYMIENEDDIMSYLLPEPHALLINDEVEMSYDKIFEDIHYLREAHKVLVGKHMTSKKTVIYLEDHNQEEEIPWKMDEDVIAIWNAVPTVDYVEVRNYLDKHGVSCYALDTNTRQEEVRRKVRDGRKKKKKQYILVSITSELAILAQKIIALGNRDDDKPLLVEDLEAKDDNTTGDTEIDVEKSYLLHNIDANPAEFCVVSDLIRTVSHWFYDDPYSVLLNCFIHQKVRRESDLNREIFLPQKQIGGYLTTLARHQLMRKDVCETAGSSTFCRSFNVWSLDLDRFCNVLHYRLLKMKEVLTKEIEVIQSEIFECPRCGNKYRSLDTNLLVDPVTNQYNCLRCRTRLRTVNSTELVEKKKSILARLDDELKPLFDMLKQLSEFSNTSSGESKANDFRRLDSHKPVYRSRNRSVYRRTKNTLDMPQLPCNKAVEDDQGEEPVDDTVAEFNPHPLYFSPHDHIFYISICQDWETLKGDAALQLAKTVADSVAEYHIIINARVYKYQLTEHSLYLGYTRGYNATELVHLFRMFSRNPVPFKTEKFIREHTNNKYYHATVTLRKGAYCVKSESPQALEQLLKLPSVRDLAASQSKIERVEFNDIVSYNFPIFEGAVEALKKASFEAGYPLIDEFDVGSSYHQNLPSFNIHLASTTNVRSYQLSSVQKLFWNGYKAHSGILVLPCGAGKTLIGIQMIAALKKPTIIFCNSLLAVTQWKEQVVKWTGIHPSLVVRFSSAHLHDWNNDARLVITTYPMFSNTTNRSQASQTIIQYVKKREWGLMVLDEVHLAPARVFRVVTNSIKSHIKLGLTATMVREDDLIQELPHLVGPKLFELDIFTLRMKNHIAPVKCVEIHCSLTSHFDECHNDAPFREEQRLLYTTNPNKYRIVDTLLKEHLKKDHKIMVFCENIFGLKWFAELLKYPMVHGETPDHTRAQVIHNFRRTKGGAVILISNVGDQSIDIPEAQVVIQLALMDGSRMQEGQRIGRVQRPTAGKDTAYFYSLVSDGTAEEKYAMRRRSFLQDCGYTVKLVEGDEWEDYVTESTEHVLREDLQLGLIQMIKNELIDRESKRKIAGARGSSINSEDNDVVGEKRKRSNLPADARQEITKKLKMKKKLSVR